PNVADQIAYWFGLKRADIERIDFDDSLDHDSLFVMLPSHVKFFNRKSRVTLYPDTNPLTLISNHQSALLTSHFRTVMQGLSKDWRNWLHGEVAMIVEEHARGAANVHELDLLRSSGALNKLGIKLGMYRGGGIDCPDGKFKFSAFPEYPCPIEIEESSSGF